MATHRPDTLEFLISGYLRKEEKKLDLYMNIPHGFAIIIVKLYPIILFRFGDFMKDEFELTNDGTTIKGNSNNCMGYAIYADLVQFNDVGINKGIHLWSVKFLAENEEGIAQCYASIGVTTEKNEDILNTADGDGTGDYYWITSNGCNSFHNACNEWKTNEIITVKLDCDAWSVTYYYGEGEKKTDEIDANKHYHFVMYCCGLDFITHYQVVESPCL